MSREEYHSYPKQITVREANIGKKVLVTTLLSPRKTAKAELEALFLQRWHVELDLRNIKTTLGMNRPGFTGDFYFLRGWGDEHVKEIFTGSSGACGAAGD